MRPPTARALSARTAWGNRLSSSSVYGRTVASRLVPTSPATYSSLASSPRSIRPSNIASSPVTFLRSEFLPRDILFYTSAEYARHFSSRTAVFQQAQKQPKVDAKEKVSNAQKQSPASEDAAEEKTGEQAKEQSEGKKAGEEENGEQKEGEEDSKENKKDAPPPPPHGDKTPWQVFTETLKTEFQASKEWNESTKQLSAGVNDFTQDPRVQKARTTYNKVTDAAASTTSEALKTTGKAIGQGAAWTWDTTPVKGVRKVASVTGSGLEYVSRPVRQSKAFKAVKDTVDDGSSSRYGGWIEKEERKRRRELRELNELQRSGGQVHQGPMEEDPE